MVEGVDKPSELRSAVEAIRRGAFFEEDAERLLDLGRDATKFVLLALAAESCRPHAPPSAVPVFEKPTPEKIRPKPRGGRPGHEGKRREKPARIDRRRTHRASCCPDYVVDGIAHESKAGVNVQLTPTIKQQILKDHWLINNRRIDGAHWHFWQGAGKDVLDFLNQHDIPYTLH